MAGPLCLSNGHRLLAAQIVAGMHGKVEQKTVDLPSKFPGALCVGTPAAFVNNY